MISGLAWCAFLLCSLTCHQHPIVSKYCMLFYFVLCVHHVSVCFGPSGTANFFCYSAYTRAALPRDDCGQVDPIVASLVKFTATSFSNTPMLSCELNLLFAIALCLACAASRCLVVPVRLQRCAGPPTSPRQDACSPTQHCSSKPSPSVACL